MAKQKKCCIPGEDLNILAACIANILAKNLSVEELSLLSTLFSCVGSALGVIAAERALCKGEDSSTPVTLR